MSVAAAKAGKCVQTGRPVYTQGERVGGGPVMSDMSAQVMCGGVKMRVKKPVVARARPASEVMDQPSGGGHHVRPRSYIEGSKLQERYRSCRGETVSSSHRACGTIDGAAGQVMSARDFIVG